MKRTVKIEGSCEACEHVAPINKKNAGVLGVTFTGFRPPKSFKKFNKKMLCQTCYTDAEKNWEQFLNNKKSNGGKTQ